MLDPRGGPGTQTTVSPAPSEHLHSEDPCGCRALRSHHYQSPERISPFRPLLGLQQTQVSVSGNNRILYHPDRQNRPSWNNLNFQTLDTQELLEPRETGPSCPSSCHPSHWLQTNPSKGSLPAAAAGW